MRHQRWRDLTPGQKRAFLAMCAGQVGLAAIAWTDLGNRPQERVNGRKPLWAVAISVNFVGPIAYLLWGRSRTTAPTP
jgi:hypothetical protein